jgi:REP element-mobilizing transposase RayT
MPRKPRENLEGGAYHVYARGNARGRIYRDDTDRRNYLWMLERVVARQRWACLAYCLMDNHVHLLVETPDANLSSGMQWLHGGYAQLFNARHDRDGHVFQGRYGAVRVRSEAQMCAAAAYIARNPVEAELCNAPAEWPWSSYRRVAARSTPAWLDVDRLFSFFGSDPDIALRRYSEMSNGVEQRTSNGLWSNGV